MSDKLTIGIPDKHFGEPIQHRKMSLESLGSPKRNPMIATIIGDGGLGKTTMASLFPSPVFIRTEDGTQAIADRKDIAMFPLAQSSQDVLDALEELYVRGHKLKTVVIDTITQLSVIIENEIVDAEPVNNKHRSINTAMGGYGAGYKAAARVHGEIRAAAGKLVEKGMNVLFLAHADAETITLPDQDPFMRYTIRMNNKSISHYTDNVDLVGMIKLVTYTSGKDDVKKATGTGERVLTCFPHPAHISKNRYGISQDLLWDGKNNPLKEYV